jgi:hypothetical protein
MLQTMTTITLVAVHFAKRAANRMMELPIGALE